MLPVRDIASIAITLLAEFPCLSISSVVSLQIKKIGDAKLHAPGNDSAMALKPSSATPTGVAQPDRTGMATSYQRAIIAAGVIAGVSVIGFSAGSDDVGGLLWTISLMGIALGLLVVAAAFSLGTRSQLAIATDSQQASITQMEESFESNAGRDWMTGLDTYSEISKQVGRELSRSGRYDRVFSVMFVTPRFEGNTAALNSGHISDIEMYTAEILRKVLRLSDGIARRTDVFGFAALLPETDEKGGQIAGQRVTEALKNPYRVGPWDDGAEMIALDAEVLSYHGDESAIIAAFGLQRAEPGISVGTTLPPNA